MSPDWPPDSGPSPRASSASSANSAGNRRRALSLGSLVRAAEAGRAVGGGAMRSVVARRGADFFGRGVDGLRAPFERAEVFVAPFERADGFVRDVFVREAFEREDVRPRGALFRAVVFFVFFVLVVRFFFVLVVRFVLRAFFDFACFFAMGRLYIPQSEPGPDPRSFLPAGEEWGPPPSRRYRVALLH